MVLLNPAGSAGQHFAARVRLSVHVAVKKIWLLKKISIFFLQQINFFLEPLPLIQG